VDKAEEPLGGVFTPALSVYRVRLVEKDSGEEVEFEEWNGKLEYLMSNCKLLDNGVARTPIQVIEQWRRREAPAMDCDESRFEIGLPPGTIAEIPFEEPFKASAIRFHWKLVTASIANGTILSRHLRELEVLQHELQDCITGGIVYKAKQSALNLGFDVELEPGKFYSGLGGTAHYYCSDIEDGIATLLMIESYQHGSLIQAEFTVKLEDAKSFVEVKDNPTLTRLQKMLADHNSKPYS
jgi:hypothetical protein